MPTDSTLDVLTAAAVAAADHIDNRGRARVVGNASEAELSRRLDAYDFSKPHQVASIVQDMFDLLGRHAVRNDSPRYFGLFNPPSLTSAVAGDLLTAAINPQLAVYGHAPAAAEIEKRLISLFGSAIWGDGPTAGTFTSGGSEANFTALLAALWRFDPGWSENGIDRSRGLPAIYASSESHLAWIKLARAAGLGASAVRLVPADADLRMTGSALKAAIAADEGHIPILIVGTAGTTAHGAVDDLEGLSNEAHSWGSHFHVDAAWAGGALLDVEQRRHFPSIERADSVTIDPHKWLAVPMGAGIYLSRSWHALSKAFAVSTSYMPSADTERHDAYIHSLQWSRRFIGGKLFVALAALGADGYAALIQKQIEMGRLLRSRLRATGWRLLNDTPFPLVCFVPDDGDEANIRRIEHTVCASGLAWISTVALSGRLALRACITSFETSAADIDCLIDLLSRVRAGQEPDPARHKGEGDARPEIHRG